MINFKDIYNEQVLNKQIEEHSKQLTAFCKLIGNIGLSEVRNDIDILRKGNEIFFDNNRLFPKYDEESLIHRSKLRFDEICKYINIENLSSFCDVGCGYGEDTFTALDYGFQRSVGIDIEPKWEDKNFGNDKDRGKLEYVKLDITQNNYNEQFDLVTSNSAFEHFLDPITMFQRMQSMVKDKGFLYIKFCPIWNSTDGHHLYRKIQVPWYHLIFSDEVKEKYNNENGIRNKGTYNKWSSFDFMNMFMSHSQMQIVYFQPLFNIRDIYFAARFPQLLPHYSLEDLCCKGFLIILQKM